MSNEMAAFFDQRAPDWDNDPSEYDTRERLTSLMGLRPGSIIADVGCGKGVMIEHLLKTNPQKIIAVDISSEMIRYAKALFGDPRLFFMNDDFYDIQISMLDAAVFYNSYPHFTDKENLVDKLSRLIKKDGILAIAHCSGRAEINGMHTGHSMSKLSVPLEEAGIEAEKFQEYFTIDDIIDDNEVYFIKMKRK